MRRRSTFEVENEKGNRAAFGNGLPVVAAMIGWVGRFFAVEAVNQPGFFNWPCPIADGLRLEEPSAEGSNSDVVGSGMDRDSNGCPISD